MSIATSELFTAVGFNHDGIFNLNGYIAATATGESTYLSRCKVYCVGYPETDLASMESLTLLLPS